MTIFFRNITIFLVIFRQHLQNVGTFIGEKHTSRAAAAAAARSTSLPRARWLAGAAPAHEEGASGSQEEEVGARVHTVKLSGPLLDFRWIIVPLLTIFGKIYRISPYPPSLYHVRHVIASDKSDCWSLDGLSLIQNLDDDIPLSIDTVCSK